jgi:hypothetical protein
MDWRAAQMVEHLLYQYEALNSNPSPLKKKKSKSIFMEHIRHVCSQTFVLKEYIFADTAIR